MIRAIRFALEGWIEMILRHRNFQIQLGVVIFVTGLGYLLRLSIMEWLVLSLTIGLVLSAEMTNSAIEAIVDLITKERRQKAKIAKDVAAGMVLLTVIMSIIIGLLLFLPKLMVIWRLN